MQTKNTTYITLAIMFLCAIILGNIASAQLDPTFVTEQAQPFLVPFVENTGYNTANTIPNFIAGVIALLLGAMGMIFLALIVYGGWMWMTARGASDQVGKAKEIISSAIIGMVIVIAGYFISFYIIRVAFLTTQNAPQDYTL